MATLQQQRQGLTPLLRLEPRYIHDHQHDQIMLSFLQAVADIVRTTLGPRAMLKMLLDASGGMLAFPQALSCLHTCQQQPFLLLSSQAGACCCGRRKPP